MILNIHGLDGSCYNTNWRLLCSMFNNQHIVSPQLDYRHLYLDYIDSQIDFYIRDIESTDRLDLIVGNSFGGFIALHLSQKYNVPCILTNPCLRPDVGMQTLLPEYLNYSNRLTISYWLKQLRNDPTVWRNTHIIFGKNDEVLDTSLSINLSKGADIITISGNHKLKGSEFELRFKEMVSKLCIE